MSIVNTKWVKDMAVPQSLCTSNPMLTASCMDKSITCTFGGSYTGKTKVNIPFHFDSQSGLLELKPSQVAYLHPASDLSMWCAMDGVGSDLGLQPVGTFHYTVTTCPMLTGESLAAPDLVQYSCDTENMVPNCKFGSQTTHHCYECTKV